MVDIPIPEEVEKDELNIEDSDWSPPPLTYRQINHKRRNSTQLPDIDEEACPWCGKVKNINLGLDGTNNEMTDKIFKFQNIQLQPSNTRATCQNTVFQLGGTAEEQFAQIQASS